MNVSEWVQNNKGLAIVLGVLAVFALGLIIFGGKSDQSTQGSSTISGIVNFNGLKPADDPASESKIMLMQKSGDETEFTDTGVSIEVADEALWEWNTAVEGTTYQLKADAYVGDEFIKSSNAVTSTAPASDQVLTFNVTLEDLPDSVVEERQVTVSGVININGYIPEGSTVTIFARESGTNSEFVPTVVEGIEAKNGVAWSADKAQAGVTYDYQAEMYTSDDTFIGQSKYLTVTAPATNEVVTVNSIAESPETAAAISGIVRLQGSVTQDSTILMLQRLVGETKYTEFDRMPAKDKTEWIFDKAVQGKHYDITASLQVNENDTATGNVIVVAAPASGETIVIDTGVNIPPPTAVPSVTCGDVDQTGNYNATLHYQTVSDAKAYYYDVGTTPGGNDAGKGSIKAPEDPNNYPEASVYIQKDKDYYTHYAYTLCTTCDVYDTQNWSGWSPTLGFKCPDK